MRIQSLVKKNNYVTVTFDNDEKLRLHYEVALQCGLRKNDEISNQRLKEIEKQEELFSLKNSALRIISRRPHSAFELKVKLQKKKFNKDDIAPIIKDFQDRGYLSDRDFAFRYAEEALSKKKGLIKIKGELISKGISREIIDEVMLSLEDEESLIENARTLANRKISSLKHKSLEKNQLKQKLYSHLNGKGYSSDIIRQVVDDLIKEY